MTEIRRRYVYVLLFAAPAVLASVIAAAVLLAASAGVLWLFVLGDDPWPPATGTLLGAVLVVAGAGILAGLLCAAYAVGRSQESQPRLNRGHVALSVGATVLLAAVVVVRLAGPTRGVRTDSLMCADFCREEGFTASGTSPRSSPDRTCSCYDRDGSVARRLPVAEVTLGRP